MLPRFLSKTAKSLPEVEIAGRLFGLVDRGFS
jgi:hypothetical protein